MSRDVCRPVFDADGNVIARARVSKDITDEGMAAVARLVEAVRKRQAEEDAADPEAAAECGRRQAAAIARVRKRAGLRGGDE